MLKKLTPVAILCLLIMPAILWAKKEKTVTIKDSLLIDQKYGFSLALSKDWKAEINDEPSIRRVYLEKKIYSIDSRTKALGGEYTIPSVLIYAENFDGTVEDFEALLKQCIHDCKSDNNIISRLGLLTGGGFINSDNAILDTINVRHLLLQRNYYRRLSGQLMSSAHSRFEKYTQEFSPHSSPYVTIHDYEVHELYIFKWGSTLFVIQTYSEREFFKENKVAFDNLLATFRMPLIRDEKINQQTEP